MRDNFRLILRDKIIRITIVVVPFFIFLQFAVLAFVFRSLPPYIPFFNSLPWGEERLFVSYIVIILPILFLSAFIVNTVLSSMYYRKHTLLARILSFNSMLFVLLGFMAFLQILVLVFWYGDTFISSLFYCIDYYAYCHAFRYKTCVQI